MVRKNRTTIIEPLKLFLQFLKGILQIQHGNNGRKINQSLQIFVKKSRQQWLHIIIIVNNASSFCFVSHVITDFTRLMLTLPYISLAQNKQKREV